MAEYIKQQVLEFESHLAAATSKQQITESTSLLISQLTRMEPTYVDVLWHSGSFDRHIFFSTSQSRHCFHAACGSQDCK